MQKLKEVIEGLDYDELIKVKRELKNPSKFKKMISEQIKKNEKEHEKICAVCQANIIPESVYNYTLIFGPDDFKKKATFCAIDCLEYFLNNLKKTKSSFVVEEEE